MAVGAHACEWVVSATAVEGACFVFSGEISICCFLSRLTEEHSVSGCEGLSTSIVMRGEMDGSEDTAPRFPQSSWPGSRGWWLPAARRLPAGNSENVLHGCEDGDAVTPAAARAPARPRTCPPLTASARVGRKRHSPSPEAAFVREVAVVGGTLAFTWNAPGPLSGAVRATIPPLPQVPIRSQSIPLRVLKGSSCQPLPRYQW